MSALAVTLAAALLALMRLPADIRNVVWAEDGRIFLGDSLRGGPLQGTFDVYEGYLHVIPRLLADLAIWAFPLERYAVASTAMSCVVAGIVAGLVYVCSRDLLPRRSFRVLLALVTVLAPSLSQEVLGNFANLHWIFLWLAPWLLLARPRSWTGAATLATVGLACALTEIQMLLFVPLALVNAGRGKCRLVAAAIVVGVCAQVFCAVSYPRSPSSGMKPGLLDIVVGYGELPVLGSFDADSSRLGDALANGGLSATLTACFLVIVIVVFALVPACHGPVITRIVPIALVAGSFISWAAAIWLNPRSWWQYADYEAEQLQQLVSTRYVAVPSMLLLGALIFSAAYCFDATQRGKLVSGVAVGVLALTFISSYYVDDVRRSDGPPWSESVHLSRTSCSDGRAVVTIKTMPADWSVTVPCRALGADPFSQPHERTP